MLVAKELTELVAINPTRVDQVKTPANGFPVLIMKSASKAVNAQGGIDEKPDIDGAEQVLQLIARLIQSEASEMAVGQWDELCDIETLVSAAHCMQCFRRMEMYGDEDDGDSVMKSADFPNADELKATASYVLKRKVSSAERKRLASEGKALPDGSYPIENAEDLHNAAVLARSGHGDVAAAKRLIAKRAKELGVANPLADSASKETVNDNTPSTETAPTTETPDVSASKSAEPDEAFKEAVAKAMEPLQETVKGLRDELAALKALPVPGGPAVSAAPILGTAKKSRENAALAARYERLSKEVQDRDQARFYAEKARELRAS